MFSHVRCDTLSRRQDRDSTQRHQLIALGDVQRPTQGYQIGDGPDSGHDIIFPLTITQCEPVLIYYNLTHSDYALLFPLAGYEILNLYFPAGVGYLDWICDIPAGYSFVVCGFIIIQYYTVEPGSSSACLGNLTTTYEYAHYSTTHFQSYTQHSPSGDPYASTYYQQPTIEFPTSSFPTITVNPNIAVIPTTARSTASSPLSSPVTPTTTGSAASSPLSSPSTASSVSSHKSNTPVIAGGVVGGIAFVLLTITIIFVVLRKRRNSFSNSLLKSATPYLTSQLGSTSLPSSDSTNAMLRRGKFICRTPVPDIPRRNHVSTHKPRYPGANSASTLDVTRLTAGQRQVLMASLNASANPTTPPATEPPVHEAAQEEFPEIANVLGVISQLDPETRNALVTSLHNLLMVDQATPPDLTTGNTPSLPPTSALFRYLVVVFGPH